MTPRRTSLTPGQMEGFMRECFRLAAKGKGRVSPNPLVGALLVRDGRIVSRGYHRFFGGPHAEAECIGRYDGDPSATTLVVNLEPCSYFGKTPPCADLIVSSGIRRVVVGMKDPNPLVSGRGIRKMRRAGVKVTTGILEEEARTLNRVFVRHIVRRRPYVHVKIAQSLDGFISSGLAGRERISSRPSETLVHRWRAEFDAVLVGAGTILADNPSLNVRLVRGRNPDVVVLDGRLTVSPDAAVFADCRSRRVFICTDRRSIGRHQRKMRSYAAKGVAILALPGRQFRLRLKDVLASLYSRRIASILVEGGSVVFGEFMSQGLVDELSIFMAPTTLGRGVPVCSVRSSRVGAANRVRPVALGATRIGRDLLLQASFT